MNEKSCQCLGMLAHRHWPALVLYHHHSWLVFKGLSLQESSHSIAHAATQQVFKDHWAHCCCILVHCSIVLRILAMGPSESASTPSNVWVHWCPVCQRHIMEAWWHLLRNPAAYTSHQWLLCSLSNSMIQEPMCELNQWLDFSNWYEHRLVIWCHNL
jgi:hypothetical protein